MKISAHNKLRGTITYVSKGATTAHVRIELGHGVTVHPSKPTVFIRGRVK